jgi:hypothetical protein
MRHASKRCEPSAVISFDNVEADCKHDVEDMGNGWGRCRLCGDDTFPIESDVESELALRVESLTVSLDYAHARLESHAEARDKMEAMIDVLRAELQETRSRIVDVCEDSMIKSRRCTTT